MVLHFSEDEYRQRAARLDSVMQAEGLGGLLLFAQESMYWLTGYDTFGFCFFQCMLVPQGGRPVLLTRAPDLRQARFTSNLGDIRIWKDAADAEPARDLRALLEEFGLEGARLGIERDTHGLTAAAGRSVDAILGDFAELADASQLVSRLRLIKSEAELACARRAGELVDAGLDAALPQVRPGGDEGEILAAMQGAIFAAGGDYPANPFIIGSGEGALLCRYYSGRRRLSEDDQLTLEWAAAWHHYHAARMNTLIVGRSKDQHRAMYPVAREALAACEERLVPGCSFGDVYAAHAGVVDAAGLGPHRLNACGYSLGARYAPSWMDGFMFYEGNPEPIAPGMVLFLHMILMDSDSGTSMCLGRTSIVHGEGSEPICGRGPDPLAP